MVSDTIMNNIQLSANKTLFYDKEIRLEYKLKITKNEYENKDNNQLYVRYKIKIPEEIRKLLRYQKYLYFTTENDVVHIKTSCKEYMHRTRFRSTDIISVLNTVFICQRKYSRLIVLIFIGRLLLRIIISVILWL